MASWCWLPAQGSFEDAYLFVLLVESGPRARATLLRLSSRTLKFEARVQALGFLDLDLLRVQWSCPLRLRVIVSVINATLSKVDYTGAHRTLVSFFARCPELRGSGGDVNSFKSVLTS